jgi:demethylmenaquinone methyltransferase/2-methoxy-6-polyprenyl-1,4-benzoquinol methylase
MEEYVKPYKDSLDGKKKQVSQMFDNISGNYDALNRVITFGMDISWRKNVFNIAKSTKPESILDIATGTGDMAIMFAKTDASKIVGLDISAGMLEVAKTKVRKANLENTVALELGDAEHLPFEDNSFDVVSVTYGIRNFEDLELGLSEILRVLSPNGTLVILETSVPEKFPMKQGYVIYTKYMLPLIGRLFSKDKKAYAYLSESAMVFPYGERLKVILEKIGFQNVKIDPQAQGISTIYSGTKLA